MRLALAGVQGSGKSTLFRAFTGATPAPTGRPDVAPVAVIKVPDPRLVRLRDMYHPEKYTPAAVDVVDLPGLPGPGDPSGERRPDLLAAARESDGLMLVIRAFEEPSYPYPDPAADPVGEAAHLVGELAFADLDVATKRLEKLAKSKARAGAKELEEREAVALQRIVAVLEEGGLVKDVELNADEEKLLRGFRFLTQKPWVLVLSLPEGADPAAAPAIEGSFEAVTALCGGVEAEIAELDPEDRAAFLEEMGVDRPATEVLLEAAWRGLGAITFFTVGEDEVRAWTLEGGGSAVEAAGRIHSDLARGFIRAEVTPCDDLLRLGTMADVRKAGLQRLEGKEYPVKDGDILNIRFSV